MTPWGVASLGPRGLMQDLCRGPLNIARPHGFRVEDFLIFSHDKSVGANDP